METEIPSKLENGDFNYISVTNYNLEKKEVQTSKKPIKLFKLHGSLNWAQCQGCHKIYYFNKKIYNSFWENPSNIPECYSCNKENKKLMPIIVPPTFSKLKNSVFNATQEEWKHANFLNQIWNGAFYQIAFSEEIYFIGYSFPQTDAQMRIFVSMHFDNLLIVLTPAKSLSAPAREWVGLGGQDCAPIGARFTAVNVWLFDSLVQVLFSI